MLDSIADVMKAAYEKSWISTRDGNASFRRKDETFLYVTPSGVRKQHMNSEMMIKLELRKESDAKYGISHVRVMDNYQRKIIGLEPTGELPLHILLQKNLPTNRVVMHLHPTYIIAAMYAGYDLQELARQFPEISRYTKVGPMVPNTPPISEELAFASIEAFGLDLETGEVKYDIIGLDRHGIVVVAEDAWSAFDHVERVESVCHMALAAGKDAYLKNLIN
jgi:ribulose-5-phosphate 4-epimerase/fuculose-1-phosphate aldolase